MMDAKPGFYVQNQDKSTFRWFSLNNSSWDTLEAAQREMKRQQAQTPKGHFRIVQVLVVG